MLKKHIPGRVQVSTECNQDCLFCSVPKFPSVKPCFNEIKQNIKVLKASGTTDLFITGGEPTLRGDLFQILDFAKKAEFKEITIQSNGSFLTKAFLQQIKSYRNVKFDIAFHSSDKRIFNQLSNSQNYKSLLSGLENIQNLNLHVYLTIVVNKLNYKQLQEHVRFIRRKFANITHFSLNFIDPVGRALKNKWIIPTLLETERHIHETVKYILSNGLTFRLERVPLCYMAGFEEFSTEARMPIFGEKRLTYFAQKELLVPIFGEKNQTYFIKKKPFGSKNLNIEKKNLYCKTEGCGSCFLNSLCPGLNPNYMAIYGAGEIFPVFIKPENIVGKIINSNAGRIFSEKKPFLSPLGENSKIYHKKNKKGVEFHAVGNRKKGSFLPMGNEWPSFNNVVRADLGLFHEAIKNKPNKNNIYDTYSYFLMHDIGFKDKSFIYEAWKMFLDKVRKGEEPDLLNFYIHFPYCQSSCGYCVYPSTPVKDPSQIEAYLDYLAMEMKKFSLLFRGLKFKSFSIGGGTPSLMSELQLKKLLDNIYKYFHFDDSGEKSIEFNPNTTTAEKLKIISDYGINKLSLGVQSLSWRVLRENNRSYQTIEKVRKAITDFKKTGIPYLNVDLLLGLMGDTPEDFLYTFEEICKMKPRGISIYPIKTNEQYIKPKYGNLKNFTRFYYRLFDIAIKKMPSIAEKYDFNGSENSSLVSYVHPLSFSIRNHGDIRGIKYNYANYKVEPYSNFGIGYYSESCINNMMRYIYVDKSNLSTMFLKGFSNNPDDFVYSVNRFAPHYAKVKFITHSAYEYSAVFRDKYREMFKTDIASDFPYAIAALAHFDLINVTDGKIIFKVGDEKEIYAYLLFFVGRDYVLPKVSFLG